MRIGKIIAGAHSELLEQVVLVSCQYESIDHNFFMKLKLNIFVCDLF